ncbi:Aldehyde/histidinol dehydrogenase [Trichoderma evansii]
MSASYQNKFPFELADPGLFRQESYVHGKWVTSVSGKIFIVIDPGSEMKWASCPDNVPEDVDTAVISSHQGFLKYSALSPGKRAQLLLDWHKHIDGARDDLAKILTYETGRALTESYTEIDYFLSFVKWFAGEAERIQGTTSTPSAFNKRVMVIKQPIGVSVALVPWNLPIAMVLRKAGAALAAGCSMIVKPSPETPISCLVLAELATRAGFPAGTFNVLTTSLDNTPSLSESLCVHPLVKKITFTGSTRVGKIIAGLCSINLKQCTLELGGNCPFIVFDDADLNHALTQLMALKWRNGGQACTSANRVYVQAGIYDKFASMFVEKTKQFIVGHGAIAGTTFGAVTTQAGLIKAEALVQDALDHGAKIISGVGKRMGLDRKGFFIEPTILTNMNSGMRLAHDEVFGPVCGLFKFETEDEVVRLANATNMGLASYAFTKDVNRLWRMFESLEAGMIGLNTGNGSAAESPFGGIKQSSYGKEAGKDVGVNEYLIAKTGTLTIS